MDKSLAQEVVHGSARPGSGNEKIDGKEPAFHPATVPTPRKTDKDKVDETQKELLQQHFSQLFELPDEKLSEDYACALQDKLALIHGRMYISDHYVCFASTIFKQTMKKISFKDITGLYKKNTAIVFPNAIEIHTKDQRLFFMSFIFRDQAFHSLWIRWEAAKKEISQQIKSARTSVMSTRGRKKESNSEESSNDSDDSENSDSDNDSDDAKAHESDDSEDDVDQQEEDDDSDAESDEDDEASSKHSAHSTSTLGASETAGNSVATGVGLHSAAPNAAMRSSINVDTSKVKTDPEVGYRLVKRRSNSWSNDLIKKTLDESAKATDNGNNNNNEASNTTTPESNEHFTTLPVIEIPCKHVGADEAGTDYYINEFYPVSVAQFFHTLLSDKSEFWVSVNIIHDYTETVCSTWALDEAKCCYVRNMAFTSPVNAVIGPKSTRVTATQRIRFVNPDHFSFDHLSMSKDVPYGDTFYIVTRFEVTKKGNGCLLQVATTVKFTKTVWGMKGMIERLSTDSSRNFNQKFATMAKEKFPAPATPPVLEKPKAHKPKAIKPIKTKKKKPAVQPEAKPATPQSLIAAITELTSSPLVSDIVRAIYLLMLFILFVLVFSQYSTIAHLSDQVSLSMTAASKAENKILFLQHFVETVVRNVTGAEGTLKEQWVLWQSHKELLNKLDGYKIQMDLLKSEIERTQHMLGDLELEGLNADKVFEDATPTSVFAFLFKMSVLAAIAYAVYWAILNKDVILQTVSPPKKPNPPHTKTE